MTFPFDANLICHEKKIDRKSDISACSTRFLPINFNYIEYCTQFPSNKFIKLSYSYLSDCAEFKVILH